MMAIENITRHFEQVYYLNQTVTIHYRQLQPEVSPAVADEPVIMLHPSPLSSTFMSPIMPVLASKRRVIAWDTPGYGDSSNFTVDGHKRLSHYCQLLASFLDQLSIEQAVIYGNATGAQIAIEFAKLYPNRCHRLILENVAHFYDDEREQFSARYFPDLSAKADGSHLRTTWRMVKQLYQRFPWYDMSEDAKLNLPLPPMEILQQTFIDYVKAGPCYAEAYQLALANEEPEQLAKVPQKTDILLWQGSIIYTYCQRMLSAELPNHIAIHTLGAAMDERLSCLKALAE